ncbi:hypothetical protein AMECASPLE_001761 [Ameca splendens]|uniref:Protein GRINL1A n=1 Tax=Ameca splendens TaxID=208324 RepID=A0ABV0Z799_9TELE
MSLPWTERQGKVGDLRNQSIAELQELLLRQQKILSNERLLQTLPDKGKKNKDFAEKVRLAIEQRSEEERRQSLVSAARAELQSKYHQAFSHQQRAVPLTSEAACLNEESEGAAGDDTQEGVNTSLDKQEDRCVSTVEIMKTATDEDPLNCDQTKESKLVEAMDRVSLSETSAGQFKERLGIKGKENYFLRKQLAKKPHYITVLEKTETSAAPKKHKFRPNQLPHKNDGSPLGSLSPGQSSETASPLSAQARKERNRKHLDDITAAKLPPLHHSPAQLLSLDESAALVREQIKKQQEMQAKLAAQKLSEGLKISMGSYTPDGGPMAAYREVYDEGAHLSSEED